ncbi:MAG: PH domain-containing protein [Alphaproteobacteria bacterium]|nr:PH domain-containing protein [Alphaproteobacteria bacterium]
MLYIQQSLGPDEELVHVGHFHWMYTIGAFLNILWGLGLCIFVLVASVLVETRLGVPLSPGGIPKDAGWLDLVRGLHPGIKILSFFLFVMGLMRFASMMIQKVTTEIAITNTRLVYKRGLVARYVGEMSIDRIEGVNVLQGVLGRILNYGRVMVRGMGVGEVVLPPIEDPVAFRKAIDKARSI